MCNTFCDSEIERIREELLIRTIRSAVNLVESKTTHSQSNECMHWIMSDNDYLPFSFNTCCRSIGIDSDVLRGLIIYIGRIHTR